MNATVRLLPIVAIASLTATALASATTQHMRTLDVARGRGSVALAAHTASINTELWIDRTGGTSLAHVSAGVSCHRADGMWLDQASSFSLRPSSRHLIWRHGTHAPACVLTVSATVRGAGLLVVALRGY